MSNIRRPSVPCSSERSRLFEKIFTAVEQGDYAEAAIRITQAKQADSSFSSMNDLLFRTYNPNEPCDEKGRWTTGGAEISGSETQETPSVGYCKMVKKLCIVEATSTLQTSDYGFQFWNKMNACMDRHGCLGVASL